MDTPHFGVDLNYPSPGIPLAESALDTTAITVRHLTLHLVQNLWIAALILLTLPVIRHSSLAVSGETMWQSTDSASVVIGAMSKAASANLGPSNGWVRSVPSLDGVSMAVTDAWQTLVEVATTSHSVSHENTVNGQHQPTQTLDTAAPKPNKQTGPQRNSISDSVLAQLRQQGFTVSPTSAALQTAILTVTATAF